MPSVLERVSVRFTALDAASVTRILGDFVDADPMYEEEGRYLSLAV